MRIRFLSASVAALALVAPQVAGAQSPTPPADPAVAPPPVATPAGAKRVYTAADFARFAPRTAFDMLVQVPGFDIRQADEEQRGLGQASENVLIAGQRIANKSGGAVAELQRISASNVERIEIGDAASLGIAGLSGSVANVILKAASKSTGQFEWQPDVRAHYARPNLYNGSASYSGKQGPVDYTLSLKNDAGRGAFGGPIRIFDPAGNLTERRHEVLRAESDEPTLSTKFGLDGPGSSVGNLTLAYTRFWRSADISDRRTRLDGDNRLRNTLQELDGWSYDVNADYEFALGPGRLKLIGVREFEHQPVLVTQVTAFDSGADDEGIRFSRDSRIGETIGRLDYGWKTGSNDWRVTLERAYNSLDQRGRLFTLTPDGEFDEVDFPQGTGKVAETRYEGIATLSRPLSAKLDLQVSAGGEISTLARVDGDLPARKFFRPKGSVNLGWRPSQGWDLSLRLRRKVGQISFYDFLAQPRLLDDREDAGNPDLVPPQSWEVETEIGRELGSWGKTRLKIGYHRVEDIIDVIPIGENGQGTGNLPRATQLGFENSSTILFDPLGWKGAKIDLEFGMVKTSVRDPLTGEKRPISGTRDRWIEASLRHDIPGSNLAWGVNAQHHHFAKRYFLTEVFRGWEGPVFMSAYVEHKDIMGLTVRGSVGNLLNARHRLDRVVYSGRRDREPVAFIQENNQLIGPIFSLSVKGNF